MDLLLNGGVDGPPSRLTAMRLLISHKLWYINIATTSQLGHAPNTRYSQFIAPFIMRPWALVNASPMSILFCVLKARHVRAGYMALTTNTARHVRAGYMAAV